MHNELLSSSQQVSGLYKIKSDWAKAVAYLLQEFCCLYTVWITIHMGVNSCLQSQQMHIKTSKNNNKKITSTHSNNHKLTLNLEGWSHTFGNTVPGLSWVQPAVRLTGRWLCRPHWTGPSQFSFQFGSLPECSSNYNFVHFSVNENSICLLRYFVIVHYKVFS